MKTTKGCEVLQDKKGNQISVRSDRVPRLLKAGWRRPGESKPKPPPKDLGGEKSTTTKSGE